MTASALSREETPSSGEKRIGGSWPTEEQLLLLRAALLDGESAFGAWRMWRQSTDLASVDIESRRLFPRLYRNLKRLRVDDPLVERFKESFSRTYFENHLLFERATAVLRALEESRVPTMVLKGVAMTSAYYGDVGLRPMLDFDILVPAPQALAAMNVLKRLGWHGTYHREPEKRIDVTHSVPFRDPTSRQIDLHWHVLTECWHADDDRGFWEHSVPVDVNGVATRRLDATDQLMHTCVHGRKWDDPPPLRWIADAMAILHADGASIAWDRLISNLEYRHLVLPGLEALEYLRDHFEAHVPEVVVRRLRESRTTRVDRFIYRMETAPYRRLSTAEVFGILYADLMRIGSSRRGMHRVTAFARRTRALWRHYPTWQLPFRLPVRLLVRVGRRVGRSLHSSR
jgi:hypothetical protein